MKTTKVTQNNGPTAEGIASVAKKISKKGTPPLHLWDPPFCGDLDIRIARDGTWYYLGTPTVSYTHLTLPTKRIV